MGLREALVSSQVACCHVFGDKVEDIRRKKEHTG